MLRFNCTASHCKENKGLTSPGQLVSGNQRDPQVGVPGEKGELSRPRHHRILAGLTQQELAERAGIHRASIAALENTKHPARPRTLKKLADALGMRTQHLAEPGNATHKMPGVPPYGQKEEPG